MNIRKISLIAAVAFASIGSIKADEGMWMLPLLEKMNIGTMQEMGLQLSAEDLYSINSSSLKDAVVHFGRGCTGEIISPQGLLITNHHCGYANIQKLSSVDHDYLKDGYWAMNLNEELPCEGLTVTFLQSMTDITADIAKIRSKAESKGKNPEQEIEKYTGKLIAKAKKADKYCDASIRTFYNDNAIYLIVSKTYKDIRFVGAPPSSIGKFGADTDNWMWPRHTGDFSMFRIYADKDNNPAPYSKDNVPYRADRHLTISLKGISEGDYTMIMGYPGRTNRYMTSAELEMMERTSESMAVRGERQKILMEDMLADPQIKIQYASKYARSSNGWKKWIGMGKAMKKLGIIERKRAEEDLFMSWIQEDDSRKARYANALSDINSLSEQISQASCIFNYYSETINNIEILKAASMVLRGADREEMNEFYKDYSAATDRKVARRMIDIYVEKVPSSYIPSMIKEMTSDEVVEKIFSESVFSGYESLCKAMDSGADFSADPAAQLITEAQNLLKPAVSKIADLTPELNKAKMLYTEGVLEMRKGEAVYPDANSTMRLTYGTVKSYSPRDAVIYNYYTTLDGVMQKEDPDNWEFTVPDKLKELYARKDYGRYGMIIDGEMRMPVAFLSNNDITGGNSGSPVLNGKGELVGVAFDGNWESMSSDIMFEPDLQRCINVDIRYVLFIIDKFGGAGYLLNEMTIVE